MTTTPARLRKAVLPVAGLGTRVLPGTKTTPKELLNVVDRPILSYIVEEAREAGIEHIVFVTGRSKGAIEDYFDHQIELEAQPHTRRLDRALVDRGGVVTGDVVTPRELGVDGEEHGRLHGARAYAHRVNKWWRRDACPSTLPLTWR